MKNIKRNLFFSLLCLFIGTGLQEIANGAVSNESVPFEQFNIVQWAFQIIWWAILILIGLFWAEED